MASPRKALPVRLFELLEEQQEPFSLDVCLLDRTIQSKATFMCWRLNSQCISRRKDWSWRCLPTKLRCWQVIKRALNWNSKPPNYRRLRLSDCFAKARSGTRVGEFHRLSCSRADAEVELNGDIERKDYELSPVSVLDMYSDEDSSIHNHSMEEENQSGSRRNSPTEVSTLFKEAKREVPKVEERTCLWEHQWGDLALINNLVSLDLHESSRKWSQVQDQRTEICIQIESFIFEELSEECVLDMLGSPCTLASCSS